MKFTEAIKIVQSRPPGGTPFRVTLACGFTPLHLQTFIAAHLQARMPARPVEIATGLYGDLAGTIEAAGASPPDAAAIAIEWADLDPRLDYRRTGGWAPADLDDIVTTMERGGQRLERAIGSLPDALRVAVSLPTLPLPPVFHSSGSHFSEAEFRMRQAVMALGRAIAARSNMAVVSPQQLDRHSPPAARFDFKSDLFTGLPYTLAHADALGRALAELIHPAPSKKGLITDLDDTLWNGIAGDAGPEGVTWDLASHNQIHGLYQQVLRALAGQGVLIGVASKNDPAVVDAVFARADMVLPRENVFPIEAGWHAKSHSVARILKTWNIAADSVVYVDDSAMELAEVEGAHPGIHCIRFPVGDYAAAEPFLRELRDLFAKPRVTEEDKLRLASIRQGAQFEQLLESGGGAPDEFLAQMQSRVTVEFDPAANDPRVLELVNKTNQFNLNGRRCTEAEWRKELSQPGAFVASVGYSDKFGPLGKIAVIRGTCVGHTLAVGTWVMSCRAFARRIEHLTLRLLFDRFLAERIEFDFAATPRNGPLQEFFLSLTGEKMIGRFVLARENFQAKCPSLYHSVEA